MKKLMMLSIMATTLFFSATAQKITNKNVPATVLAAYQHQYPGISASWEKEKDKYEANFKLGTTATSVLYLADGTLTETEVAIKPSSLPAAVINNIKANYKGATVKEAAKITKANGAINFEAEVNGKDLIFDANGKFLK